MKIKFNLFDKISEGYSIEELLYGIEVEKLAVKLKDIKNEANFISAKLVYEFNGSFEEVNIGYFYYLKLLLKKMISMKIL